VLKTGHRSSCKHHLTGTQHGLSQLVPIAAFSRSPALGKSAQNNKTLEAAWLIEYLQAQICEVQYHGKFWSTHGIRFSWGFQSTSCTEALDYREIERQFLLY
jgi:hypothetical protein